jgi:response regulator RpfG family c-di-GMP phosphodiesterase
MSPRARVLVVSSNAEAGARMSGELRRVSLDTVLATRARTAMRIAADLQPALIVSDLQLPDMDGATLLYAVRALPGLAELPAIGLSPGGDGPGRLDPAGFSAIVAEPFGFGELAALAESLLPDDVPETERARGLVLLVDADEVSRGLTEASLEDYGYSVRTTADGQEGLRLACTLRPDAVVCDLTAPGLDGYELTVELRSARPTEGIPVILTCGRMDRVDLDLVSALGASALVARSPEMRELLEALRTCLTPPGLGAASAPAGEESIELQLHRLIEGGSPPRARLAAQSVERAFLAGFGVGIASGADAERLLDEVLARCAEVTGFRCGAAYLALDGEPPVLQGQVGFADGRPLVDFFGDPGLLREAIAAAQGGIAQIPSDRLDRRRASLVLHRAGLPALLVAPVFDAGQLLGVLVLGAARAATTPDDEALITAIAGQVGRWLTRVRTLSALSRSQRRTVERLARAAEFRDEETANHTQRVSRYCALLAQLTGLDQHRSELIGAASMMHDIGKLGIPDSILRKPGALSLSERQHMQRHADYGRKILAGESDPLLDLASVIAWTHHERWDGGGYPRRMQAESIPLEGRIVAIGDVFDALTSDRVYRPAMTLDHALELMRGGRATHFDPELLDLFIDALPKVLDIRRHHPDRRRTRAQAPALAH